MPEDCTRKAGERQAAQFTNPSTDAKILAGDLFHVVVLLHCQAAWASTMQNLVEQITAHSANAILIVDQNGIVRFANPAACSLLGRPADALVGLPCNLFMPPGQVSEIAGKSMTFEMHVSQTQWQGETAYLISLRDITGYQHAEEALRRRDAILEAVSFAAEQFLKTTDWKMCIPQVLERLGHATGVSRVYIFENSFGPDSARLTSQRFEWAAPGIEPQMDNPRLQNIMWEANGLGSWSEQLSQGQVVYGHTREFPAFVQEELTAENILSIVIVPILVGQEWWGFIGFDECLAERDWSMAEIDALRAAAGTLGAAIQRERAEAELRAQKQLFENLVAVARATAERPTLQDTLSNTLDVAMRLTGAQDGDLFLLDATGAVIQPILPRDLAESERGPDMIADLMEKGLAGWVARHGQAVLIPDVSQDDRWLKLPGSPYHSGSALSVPIMSGPVPAGVLTLAHTEPHHFTADHLRLLQAAADQMALALRNAQLFDEQRRMADRQRTLYEVLCAVGGQLEHDAIAQTAVRVIVQATHWPNVALALLDDDGASWRLAAASGNLADGLGARFPIAHGVIGRTFRTAQAQWISSVHDDPDYISVHPAIRSELAVPLQREGRVLGVLNIESEQLAAFSAEDVVMAESLAGAIALALDNARLFQATQSERGRLQALIRSSRDGVALIGMDGKILVVNTPVLELLQLPGRPEDWLGRHLRDWVFALRKSPGLLRIALEETRRIQTGDEPPGEGDYEAPPRMFHWMNLPVRYGDVTLGRLVVLRDVTAEHTADQLREDMISTMVHDLRNPLSVASTSLEFLAAEGGAGLGDDQHNALEIARAGLRKALKLITNILDLRWLEGGQVPLERTAIHIHVLVDEMLRTQASLAAAKHIRLESQVPTDLPAAWADADLIGRVLQNLVDNACKFTPAGGSVQVTARLVSGDDRPVIQVSVSDTGPGIPPSIRPRLFQKFVTGRQKGHGSGLGLAFCKLALEAHGERIWLESDSERGTTFTFSLPVFEGT